MDDKKDKFPQDEDADETVNRVIEIMEKIVDADTSRESESKTDSEKSRLTSQQISKEYCDDHENSKENALPIPSGYKEISDEPSTSNLDTSLQVPSERSARGSNPILTRNNMNAKLSTGFEIESSENTLLDRQEIKKEYEVEEGDNSKPKEEIVSNISLIIKSTVKTPHTPSPSPSGSSLRIISVRRSPSSRRNSDPISISGELPDFPRRSTVPGLTLPFFTPITSTSENLNSFLQNSTAQAASVAPPLHPGNLSAHNVPNLEPSDRTSSLTSPLYSRNFSNVHRPMWFPPYDCFTNGFAYSHFFPPNCSYCGGAPRQPIIHPFNYGTSHHLFPPSIFNPSYSQYGYNAPCPTIEHSSSISSTGANFTTPNLPSHNTLTSAQCNSCSTSGFLTNPTSCFAPSRTPYPSSDPVFTSANLSKPVVPTTVSYIPVSSANELSASGASSICCDNSSNSKRPSQESISATLLKEVRKFFANNPVVHPEGIRRIDNSINLRNSDEKGGLLNIPPSQAAKNTHISQRVSTPKRAREEAECPISRHSVDGRRLSSRRSRSSSISSDCSSRRSCSGNCKFRDDECELLEACELLAEEGVSEIDFRRYARAMFAGTPEEMQNLDNELRGRMLAVSVKLGFVNLSRLYDQLNKTVVGRTAYDRSLNRELSKILENPRRVSDGSPPTKSPKLSVQSQDQRTSSDEITVRDLDLSTILATSTLKKESDISLRTVEKSEISVKVEMTTNQSASTDSSAVSNLNPQSINNQLIGSSEMQSNESFDSLDPVPNEQSPEQSGSIDDANTEDIQRNEGQATFDNGPQTDSTDNESENEEIVKFGGLPCVVM